MAIATNQGVTVVPQADAPATLAVSARVKIKKIVLVSAAAATLATVTDGADKVIAMLAAPIGSSDEIDFNADAFVAVGLKVSVLSGAGGTLFIYGA